MLGALALYLPWSFYAYLQLWLVNLGIMAAQLMMMT